MTSDNSMDISTTHAASNVANTVADMKKEAGLTSKDYYFDSYAHFGKKT